MICSTLFWFLFTMMSALAAPMSFAEQTPTRKSSALFPRRAQSITLTELENIWANVVRGRHTKNPAFTYTPAISVFKDAEMYGSAEVRSFAAQKLKNWEKFIAEKAKNTNKPLEAAEARLALKDYRSKYELTAATGVATVAAGTGVVGLGVGAVRDRDHKLARLGLAAA
ncbi:hypothetical protein FRB95_012605 [Tulasnella sp. JGI-2019a]|nr:hypothetical protein FRB95_012605 [Tulasnella sp. JGI-2019a]